MKGMVSVTGSQGTANDGTPAGYDQDDGNAAVYWGAPVSGDNYRVQPAWTADEGHMVQIDVFDCITAGQLPAFISDLQGVGRVMDRVE